MAKIHNAEMWDRMQFLFRKYYDRMMHSADYYDGKVDKEKLEKAYEYMVERVPLLHSSFRNFFIKPFWKENNPVCAKEFITLIEVEKEEDVEREVEKFLTQEIMPKDKYQIKVGIIRCKDRDVICNLVCHMTMDGSDFKSFKKSVYDGYNQLVEGKEISLTVKNGTRSHTQVYTSFEEEDKKKAKKLYRNISSLENEVKFPFEGGEGIRKRIIHQTVSKEDFIRISQKGKESGYSVNDIVVACYIRSLYTLCGADETKPLSVPCMVDLRRHIKGGDSYGYSNHVGFMICTVPCKGESLADTLRYVSENTQKHKADKFLGLYSLPLLHLAYTIFPQFIAEIAIQIGYDNPLTGMSNVGIVKEENIRLSGLNAVNAWMTGGIKSTPYMQLSMTCFQKELTFTVAEKCSDRDGELLNRLLTLIKEEFLSI